MPRKRRTVPWLDTHENGTFYAHWYDESARRTKRLSLGTTDPGEAQTRFAAFLTQGEDIRAPARVVGLSTVRVLDDYVREHVKSHVIDQTRQENAIVHLKFFFADDQIQDIDIPLSRAYALARRAGVVGGGKRRAPIKDPVAFQAALREFMPAFRKELAEAAVKNKIVSIERVRELALRYHVRTMEELIAASGSDSTIRRELVVLHAAAEHAEKWKRIGPNAPTPTGTPSIELPPDTRNEAPWLTVEQIEKAILTAPTVRLRRFINITYHTAARRASIERLTKAQINLRTGLINLRRPDEDALRRQSKKRRPIVPIHPKIRPDIEQLMEESPNEFLWGDENDMYRPFVEHLTSLGYDATNPHILRHSRATHLLQRGVSIYDVAKLLGDTVATVERVYGHHCPEYLASTIEGASA